MSTSKPTESDKCCECGELIGGEPYHYSKPKKRPILFIHKRCWDDLPKIGGDNHGVSDSLR